MKVSAEQQRKMTQDYEKRNLHGFEGDEIMHDRIKKLIEDFDIDLVIESGCYLGGTTRRLSLMCSQVITTEVNLGHFICAQKLLERCTNVSMFFGDTVFLLPEILPIIAQPKNILFFLDDHWLDSNPLLAELEIIAHHKLKPVICVHDFKVPNHPELGFDTYKDIVYEWSWIKPSIEKIYGVDGYEIEYNSLAEGAKRGIVYIWAK